MSNIQDINERRNIVRKEVIDMLIEYDEYVRQQHQSLIEAAQQAVSNTPLESLVKEPSEPMESELLKQYRYLNTPIFRTVVDRLTEYILANTKE